MKQMLCKLGVVLGVLVFWLAMVCTAYGTVSLLAGLFLLAFSALAIRICWLEYLHLELRSRRAKARARRQLSVAAPVHPSAA